jgi:hypothetical protein
MLANSRRFQSLLAKSCTGIKAAKARHVKVGFRGGRTRSLAAVSFPCFRNSGNVEVRLIGLQTVTLFRFRAAGQVPNHKPGPNEQSTPSAWEPKGCRSDLRPENYWNYWNDWNHWNGLLLDVFKAMAGLNPQVKQKIISDNPRRFYLDLKKF